MALSCAAGQPRPTNIVSGNVKPVWREMTSEYTTKYRKWESQQKLTIRPPSNGELIYDASAKYDMNTMYEDTYVRHPETGRQKCIRPPQNQGFAANSSVNMECFSTYKDNFRKNEPGVRRLPFRPCPADHQFSAQRNMNEKSSVSHQNYRAYDREEFNAARRKPIIIESEKGGVFPVGDEDGQLQTTVKESFKCPGQQQRRQPIIPDSANGTNSGSAMELLTTNRADFNFKRPSPCPPAQALIRERGNRDKLQLLPFDYRSTFQDDYIQHAYVRRPKSFKPLQQYVPSETPFQPQTLYCDDFKEMPNQGPPKPYKLEGNLHLSKAVEFQGSTQYSDAFQHPPKDYKVRTIYKPQAVRHGRGRFNDKTSYNINFLQFDLTNIKPRSFKPVRKYESPTIPFQVQSTAHAHYKGERAAPSKICKPVTKKRIQDTNLVNACC